MLITNRLFLGWRLLFGNPVFSDPRTFDFSNVRRSPKKITTELPPMKSELHVELCIIKSYDQKNDYFSIKSVESDSLFCAEIGEKKVKLTARWQNAIRFETIEQAYAAAIETFRLVKPYDQNI